MVKGRKTPIQMGSSHPLSWEKEKILLFQKLGDPGSSLRAPSGLQTLVGVRPGRKKFITDTTKKFVPGGKLYPSR